MKLYLIRHAESTNNALAAAHQTEHVATRSPDPEITDLGHRQARSLAQRLAHPVGDPHQHPQARDELQGFSLTHLYCSLMTRSILTAQYVAEACGLPSVAHPELFERGGIYEHHENGSKHGRPGPGRSYFQDRFPNLILPDTVDEKGWYSRPFESDDVFVDRVSSVVAEIRALHARSEDRVAIVSHGDFIDQFINELAGVMRRPENYESYWEATWAFHNTSITRIDFVSNAEVIVYTNQITHLPPELISW